MLERLLRPALFSALGAALLLSSACGEDGPSGNGVTVAIFADTAYVDDGVDLPEDEGEAPSEVPNMVALLKSKGYRVVRFTSLTIEGVQDAVADADVVLMPEQELGSIDEEIAEQHSDTVFARFVAQGGVLVSAYDYTWLNGVFGLSLSDSVEAGEWAVQDDVAGTPFASGQDSLQNLSATQSILKSSLPGSATAVYTDDFDGVFVAIIPHGDGYIVYLGWDWYDAAPKGSVGDDWNALLEHVDSFIPVPESGSASLH